MKLYGEQKRVLFLPAQGPIQIKGVAGSGKTTVSLYRAKHLLETYSDMFREGNVAIFTYNASLVTFVQHLLPTVAGGIKKDSDEVDTHASTGLRVNVLTFHKWAWHFLNQRGFWRDHAVLEDGDAIIARMASSIQVNGNRPAILSKTPQFYKEEIQWIKGKLFSSLEEYQSAQRIGRGTKDRVTADDKALLWKIYANYQQWLTDNNKIDFDDFAIHSLRAMDADSSFSPPFSHIVVDEAQDLSKAQMTVLTRLVSLETESFTVVADAAQRIYKSGFTWSEVGINVRGGRTIEFKKNYRNTLQTAMAAISLLANEEDRADFTDIETVTREGKKPYLGRFPDWQSQTNRLVSLLNEIDLNNESIVVLHRRRSGLQKVAQALNSAGISARLVDRRNNDFAAKTVWICTLSSIKGLEFDHVFIVDLNDDVIPYPPGFTDDNDEYHISTERRLMYTAMTRARERLYMMSSATPSRYLSEIKPDNLEIEQ